MAAQSYWGEWCNHQSTYLDIPEGTPINLDKLSSVGWDLQEFKGYVKTLLAAKCADEMMDGSNWMYDTVMAVAQDGTTKTLSMVEFAHRHLLIEAAPNGGLQQKQVPPSKKKHP